MPRPSCAAALAEITRLKEHLEAENTYLRQSAGTRSGPVLASRSPRFNRVLGDIAQVAPTNTTVVLLGETGTGKELLAETINDLYKAEAIHRRGPWKSRESVELATLEWVAWYNHERLMQPSGISPRRKLRQTTTGNSPVRPQWRLDLNQPASAIPGALHSAGIRGT